MRSTVSSLAAGNISLYFELWVKRSSVRINFVTRFLSYSMTRYVVNRGVNCKEFGVINVDRNSFLSIFKKDSR